MIKKFLFTLLFLGIATNGFTQPKIANIQKVTGKQLYKTILGEDNDEVILGDEKNATTFKPHIKFTRWNKENSLTIKVPDDLIPNATTSLVGKELIHKNHKIGFYFNRADDINFKFGLILYEKPSTNTWSFQLEGWQEFDFFYQPPLKNVNPDGSTWEIDKNGRSDRPVEVNGSYAIYHKNKANYEVGKINYRCGKFGHIFRPRILDTDNKFLCWADLHIKDGIYTITIDQKILDTAKYPIKFNDWFGTQDIGQTANTSWGGEEYEKANSTPEFNGTLTSITHYCSKVSDPAPTLFVAIYSDDGTAVNLLAGETTGQTLPDSYNWLEVSLNYADIVAETQYWLAHYVPYAGASTMYQKYDSDSSNEHRYKGSGSTPWSNPAADTYGASRIMSIYATYTPSGAARRVIIIQ